jgi:RHS repeat-associated protein
VNGVLTSAPALRRTKRARFVPRQVPQWLQFTAVLLCILQFSGQSNEPSKTVANVAYGYDALDRAVTETSGGLTHTYKYDLAGNRLSTVYGGTGRTIASTYDALNRLGTMTESGRATGYGYDLNGNIAQKTLPNGDREVDVFDALNRCSSETDTAGNGSSLYIYNYGYDLVGNVVTVGESYPSGLNNRTVTNTYDNINRLLVEAVASSTNVTTTYAYDNGNNRTSKSVAAGGSPAVLTNYTYNNLNQLTGYGDGTRSVTLTYDADGNRSGRTVSGGSDNGTDSYGYDFENRLIQLVKGTTGSAGTYNYTYDYRTRRIVRDESNAGGVVTDLVFSGGTSVQEYDTGGTGSALSVEYIRGSDYGGGVGGILYTLRGGTPSYTHENKRGDVVAKTDGSGNLTFQTQYEAFGKQVATSGSTLDRQKSNSKDTDPTGLVDEGFRYRDLDTGMFISRDPAGFVDGPNLYTYVIQNPWTSFDPEGLFVPGVGLVISAGFEVSDTARYVTGYSSAKEYGMDTALNIASAAADLSDGETGFVDAGAQTAGRLAIKASLKSLAVGGADAAGHAGMATVNAVAASGTVGTSSGTTTTPGTKDAADVAQDNGAAAPGKGGVGPVNKGKAGVDKSEEQFVEAGGTIEGKEVTFELPSGKRTRADLTGTDAQGKATVIESKNGPNAKLTDNQKEMQQTSTSGGTVTPRGKNAAAAGLTPGKPIPAPQYQVDQH